jgi:hypothetical protein
MSRTKKIPLLNAERETSHVWSHGLQNFRKSQYSWKEVLPMVFAVLSCVFFFFSFTLLMIMRVPSLNLCQPYLKPYCMGRKTFFFQQAFNLHTKARAFRPAGGV